jgi:uncharacterized protein YcbK (DUF882 family)
VTYPNQTYVSAHLRWHELACHDKARTPYPREWEDRAVVLARVFEAIRASMGMSLIVNSAYRTVAHNEAVKGGTNSQHLAGRALDLTYAGCVDTLYGRVVQLAETMEEIGGIGRYDSFVHVDTRPRVNERVVLWDLRKKRHAARGVESQS